MKKIALATLLATLALIFAASLPVAQAQPAFTGAPRAANTWLTSDPRGFDQLRYLARHSSVLDALDAAITNVMWTLYIVETNRAQVAEGVLTDAVVTLTNSIPAAGCTDLGTATAVTITGATVSWTVAPTGVYTVSVAQAASRYCYALEIVSTNACTLTAGLSLRGSWTITGTNILAIVPGTGTLWQVYGRGL